jgi:hypothetical protein
MTMANCFNRTLRPLCLVTLTSLLLPLCGCSGGGTHLTVTSLQNHQTYQQPFTKAYAGRSEQGDFDVVLVRDGAGGKSVNKESAGGVRQVMHVRVLWKPMKGTKLDHPTATNATIDWYVFDGSGAGGVVAYSGAGYVDVQKSNGLATLDIRNATLKPTTREGGMVDPIGPAKLQGTVVARTGRTEQVREILSQTREVTAQANAARDAARDAARTAAAREASSRAPVEP